MSYKFSGFDWDLGNWPKCNKHGVTKEEIQEIFMNVPCIMSDPFSGETRFRAIGKTVVGRYIFIIFTFRHINNEIFIRPISARYMYKKEIEHYEKTSSQENA